MTVNDSSGEGRYQGYDTASSTSSILPGRVVEFDSSGDIILATATPVVDNYAGIAASKARTLTTAAKQKIVVQQSGIAHIVCGANAAFSAGNFVRVASAGEASTVASATTITSTALAAVIGRVETVDATTEGTTVVVKLK